jgi:DNA-binding Lrp family transcriptional regulator
MSIDIEVLRAMLRLARRRTEATEAELGPRVRAEPSEIRSSIRRLRVLGLIESRGSAARLTLEGLALSVALARPSARSATRALVGRSRAA